jgi:glycosyltransferase involved in cell wall biosynthesis
MVRASPRLSIVIVTRNRAKYLKRSLDSLLECVATELPDTEVIVVDGASTDGTVELLQSYGKRVHWISEPDTSVGEAFNKGLALARGEIFRSFGDDDELPPGSLKPLVELLDANPNIDVVFGHNTVALEDANGNLTEYSQRKFEGRVSIRDMWAFPRKGIFIPECMFARRAVLQRVNGYDQSFKYWGYLDFFFRLVLAGAVMEVLPVNVLKTYQTPSSDSIVGNGSPKWVEEWQRIQRHYVPIRWRLWHWFDGDLSPRNVLARLIRAITFRMFGQSPRELWRSRARS